MSFVSFSNVEAFLSLGTLRIRLKNWKDLLWAFIMRAKLGLRDFGMLVNPTLRSSRLSQLWDRGMDKR